MWIRLAKSLSDTPSGWFSSISFNCEITAPWRVVRPESLVWSDSLLVLMLSLRRESMISSSFRKMQCGAFLLICQDDKASFMLCPVQNY